MYKYLGKWANCSGYLKKHKDGVYVECFNANKEVCSPTDEIDSAVAWKLSEDGLPYAEELKFEGDCVLKTYYRLMNSECPFKAVVVGEAKVVVVGKLYADITYDHNGAERRFIGKQPCTVIDCYVVYYGKNRKRYVPKKWANFKEWTY